jgi:ATP-dependent protease Clp ATPase subunit
MLHRLAILPSPAYRGQGFGPRILITAPPGAGKTFLLSALAESVWLPTLHIDASILTPEGWSGTNVSELIGKRVGSAPGQYPLRTWQRGAVLVLDEIDKACRASPDDCHGTAVRLERQHTMLGLVWGGTPIRLSDGAEIKTDRWIIAACGAFASSRFVAKRRPPTDDELVAWGMSAELASRFPTRLVLAPMGVPELIERLRADPRGLSLAIQLAAAYGITVEVPDATLARLAVAANERPEAFSVRAASAALVQAVVERLAHVKRDEVGGRLVIAPDDVLVPRHRPAPRDDEPPDGRRGAFRRT